MRAAILITYMLVGLIGCQVGRLDVPGSDPMPVEPKVGGQSGTDSPGSVCTLPTTAVAADLVVSLADGISISANQVHDDLLTVFARPLSIEWPGNNAQQPQLEIALIETKDPKFDRNTCRRFTLAVTIHLHSADGLLDTDASGVLEASPTPEFYPTDPLTQILFEWDGIADATATSALRKMLAANEPSGTLDTLHVWLRIGTAQPRVSPMTIGGLRDRSSPPYVFPGLAQFWVQYDLRDQ